MLSKEQALFLEIMKSSVNNTAVSKVPDDIDWDSMLNIAKFQSMKALLYNRIYESIKANPSLSAVSEQLVLSYSASLVTYQKRKYILEKIETKLTEAQIPFFVFKGTEIANLYDCPEIRTMGDSDILVREEDRERVHQIFVDEIGMENKIKGRTEWIYYYSGIQFELHCTLMDEHEVGNYQSHKDFMNRRWDYANKQNTSSKCHLDWNYHFVYVLLHLRKHFINCGVGFRQFMDLAVMIKKCNLNWEWINNEIALLGLTQFSEVCFSFCQRWFGVSAPLSLQELEQDFYELATQNIFSGGVFGFDNKENAKNYVILQIKDNKTKGKLSILLSTLFPSYSTLIFSDRYTFLRGKPYLLPFAWIYRFFYLLTKKTTKNQREELKNKMKITSAQVDDRKNFIDKWGAI